jgi:hypothetical protein
MVMPCCAGLAAADERAEPEQARKTLPIKARLKHESENCG